MIGGPFTRDERGAAIIEFAIVAPVLILFLFGAVQVGEMLFANADLRNAVASGSRVASVFPRPEDNVIRKAVEQQIAGLDQNRLEGPVITHGTNANGFEMTEISVTYTQPVDFIIFETSPVVLRETQRVFTQPSQ